METEKIYIWHFYIIKSEIVCYPFLGAEFQRKKVHMLAHWKITNPMVSNLTNLTTTQHIDVYRPNREHSEMYIDN